MTGLPCPSHSKIERFMRSLLCYLSPHYSPTFWSWHYLAPFWWDSQAHQCVSAGEQSQRKRYKSSDSSSTPWPSLPLKSLQNTAIHFPGDTFEQKKLSYFSKFPASPSGHHSCTCQKYSVVLLPVIHEIIRFLAGPVKIIIQHSSCSLCCSSP